MKKSDLKQLIKPLVKECIQEMLIEEGLLSNVVAEVAKGMQANLVIESAPHNTEYKQQIERTSQSDNSKKLQEYRKKMMDAIGNDAYNGVDLFEGTTPAPSQQQVSPGSVDLGNSRDAGVDISSLMGSASKIWDAMK